MQWKVIWMSSNNPPPPAAAGLVCSKPHLIMVATKNYTRMAEGLYNHRLKKWIILDDGNPAERVTLFHPLPPDQLITS